MIYFTYKTRSKAIVHALVQYGRYLKSFSKHLKSDELRRCFDFKKSFVMLTRLVEVELILFIPSRRFISKFNEQSIQCHEAEKTLQHM